MKQKSFAFESRQAAVVAALQASGSRVVSTRAGEASFMLGSRTATANWDADWFTMTMATERCRDGRPTFDRVQNTLHLNALSSNVRYAYSAGAANMHVIAEFPLRDIAEEEFELAGQRAVNARVALEHAGVFERHEDAAALWETVAEREPRQSVRSLLREAGWSGIAGEDEHCRVDLELAGGHGQATVTRDDKVIRLCADVLEDAGDPSEVCVYAACLCLLTRGSDTRLVAATADLREEAFMPRLQVVLPASADAEWLNHGLAALCVAFDMAAAEVEALCHDEALAKSYLAMQEAPDTVRTGVTA